MKKLFTLLFVIAATSVLNAQQGIGYYPNMDGSFQNQGGGNLGTTRDSLKWSYVASGNGQARTIVTTGGYGSSRFLTVGKNAGATTNSSTTCNSNEVRTRTFLPNTLYVIQFHYKANVANAATPDPASQIFISADGTSGTRKTKTITLTTPTIWTKFFDTVRTDNVTAQAITATAGINIKTTTIGTATLVDVDNFVIYPADNQAAGGADVTAPSAVTGANAIANSPADIAVSWNAPAGGIDSGGYVVVRYAVNPSGTDNLLQNAIYSVNDSVNNTNYGRVVYIGKDLSFIDNNTISGNTTYYYKIYAVDKAFNYASAVATSVTTPSFTTYYYNGTGNITDVASWGTNTNGTGTAPTNFTTAGSFYNIRNAANVIISSAWLVSGSASKIILGDATQAAITLTIPTGSSLTGLLDVVAPVSGKHNIVLNGGIFPTMGVVTGTPDLTVGTDVSTTIPKRFWGNVIIASPSTVTINMGDTLYVNNFTVNAGAIFSATTNASTNNTIPPITIASGGSVIINGTFRTGKTAGFNATLNYLGTPATTLGPNSTIVYDKVSATTNQTINAIQYANLTIGGTSPKSVEAGNLKVSGNFLYTSTGAMSAAPSSIEFNGNALQIFDGLPLPYADVTFSGTGVKKLNSNVTIAGSASFNNGKVDVDVDTLFFNSTATIGSGSNTSYIITGNNAVGKVVVKGVGATSTVVVPVGSVNNFLQTTLTPTSSSDFAISTFEGLTSNGAFNGTSVDGATLAESVNAVWDISRINGTGNVLVEVNWPNSLEGANFSVLPNTSIKLLHNNGTDWLPGNTSIVSNVNNIASDSFSTFSPFAVSKFNGLLPVQSITLNASKIDNSIKVNWKTINEKNIKNFVMERSNNGVEFNVLASVDPKNTGTENFYSFIDKNISANKLFYRIKVVNENGSTSYSNTVVINLNGKPEIKLMTNPVIGNEINVQFSNINSGNYHYSIYNNIGQLLERNSISIAANSGISTISLNKNLTAGVYYIKVEGENCRNTISFIHK